MPGDVIIVGAPRSGTNMLRDVLSSLPGFTTWPCDEINLIWKHGNRTYPSDELRAEHADPEVTAYLRTAFAKIGRAKGAHTVVEKTCANSLRIEFVAESFPDARYIFIYRDGIDAAASAINRWGAPFDLTYTARKARYVPLTDIPYYARTFTSRIASRRRGGNGVTTGRNVTWWGPRMDDARQLQAAHPLDELAIIQWQRCVEGAIRGFESLNSDQIHCVQYERFVTDPASELEGILSFLGHAKLAGSADLTAISPRSVGKGRASLDQGAIKRLEAQAHETLAQLGYA